MPAQAAFGSGGIDRNAAAEGPRFEGSPCNPNTFHTIDTRRLME